MNAEMSLEAQQLPKQLIRRQDVQTAGVAPWKNGGFRAWTVGYGPQSTRFIYGETPEEARLLLVASPIASDRSKHR